MSWKEKQILSIVLHFSLQNYNDWLWSIADGSLPQTVINPQLSSQSTYGVEVQVKPFISDYSGSQHNTINTYFYAKVWLQPKATIGPKVQCNLFSAFQVSAKTWTCWLSINWQVWSQVCSAKLTSLPKSLSPIPYSCEMDLAKPWFYVFYDSY